MDRREFTKTVGISALALGLGKLNVSGVGQPSQISLTMDDFSWNNAIRLSPDERNQAILATLDRHSVKAALFVIGRNIDNEKGKQLLSDWNLAGHLIGNHTYSHRDYSNPAMTVTAYEEDILRAESLLKEFSRFKKYFRFPMLKEGNTAVRRDAMRRFLAQHAYRTGHVTIDNSDWIVDQRLRARLEKEPNADLSPYREFYLEHMWDRAEYYDSLARRVVGRPLKHTILTHFNLLNSLFLGDLMDMFKRKGWEWIDAEVALTDSVFRAMPKVLPAGESIVWSLAKESREIARGLRYPAEDGEYEMAKMDRLHL